MIVEVGRQHPQGKALETKYMTAWQCNGAMYCSTDFAPVVLVWFFADEAIIFLQSRSDLKCWDLAEEVEFGNLFIKLCHGSCRHNSDDNVIQRYRDYGGKILAVCWFESLLKVTACAGALECPRLPNALAVIALYIEERTKISTFSALCMYIVEMSHA